MPDCLPLTRYGSLLGKAPAGTLPGVGRVRAAAGFGAGWRQVRVPGGKGGSGGGRERPRHIVHGRGFFLVRTRRTPLGVGAAPSGKAVARSNSPRAVLAARRSGVGRDQGRKR